MSDRPRSPSGEIPEGDALERLLGAEGLLPLPAGFAGRVLSGLPVSDRSWAWRALARLGAAAALFAGAWLVLGEASPAFALALPAEQVVAVVEETREAAPVPAIAAAEVATQGAAPVVAGLLGLAALLAGPLLARRWRRSTPTRDVS